MNIEKIYLEELKKLILENEEGGTLFLPKSFPLNHKIVVIHLNINDEKIDDLKDILKKNNLYRISIEK